MQRQAGTRRRTRGVNAGGNMPKYAGQAGGDTSPHGGVNGSRCTPIHAALGGDTSRTRGVNAGRYMLIYATSCGDRLPHGRRQFRPLYANLCIPLWRRQTDSLAAPMQAILR